MNVTWSYNPPNRHFLPKLRRQASKKALDIALNIWENAVSFSPVASGELRASWDVSRGSPSYLVVGKADSSPGKLGAPLPPPPPPNVTPSASLFQSKYYITNGKTYAGYVEYGSATIPPQLMLTRAVRAAKL